MDSKSLHSRIVQLQSEHWNMIKGVECNGFEHYKYQSCKIDFWKMSSKVKKMRSNYSKSYMNISEYKPGGKFLPPIKVDEKHEFHKHLGNRANKECALYGYMRFSDWIWLLSNLCPTSLGIRVLKGMVDELGPPFYELSKRQYEFRDLKGSYIIPTQVEACLQMALLEIDTLGVRKKKSIEYDLKDTLVQVKWFGENKEEVITYAKDIISSDLLKRLNEVGDSTEISLKEVLKDYFKFLLPWPKEMNNIARHVIPWIVKYWAFFSKEFVTYWYGDELHPSKDGIPVLRPKLMKTRNPNRIFIENRGLYQEWSEMFEVVRDMPEFAKLITVCLFCEFDPDSFETVKMMGTLLKVPVMGGFGRADKYVSAPRSAPEDLVNEHDKTSIAESVFRNCLKLFDEAHQERYTPVTPDDWVRTSFGYFRSTGASENVKMNLTSVREGDKKRISLRTKAGVGVVKGDETFSKDMTRKFNTVGKQLSTGNRDVPVKATRTIFPVPLDVLVAQVCACDHLLRYASTDTGTYEIKSERFAAQISSGSAESVGSRVLDDRDLIYLSGTAKRLIITLDYGEYDSHCVWWNFRKPIMEAFNEFYSHDETKFFGRTRCELFDCGYGEGRVNKTLWNVGRKIFRASSEKIKEAEKTEEWKNNHKKYFQLVFTPVGVKPIFVEMKKVEDEEGDVLACSGMGEDFIILTSHGSGELTTLLFNSIENLSLCDQFIEDKMLKEMLSFRLRRVVGDDLVLICDIKISSRPVKNRFDVIRDRMMGLVKNSGHVANPSKTFLGYGFAEYRQTHAFRGILIPKDQVMLISSEKAKFVDAVQDFIGSIHSMFLTKISRGMQEELAEIIFWYIIVSLTRISLRRYAVSKNSLLNIHTGELSAISEKGWSKSSKKAGLEKGSKDRKITKEKQTYLEIQACKCKKDDLLLEKNVAVRSRKERYFHIKDIFFPSYYWYILPCAMNGGGIHPLSFYIVSTEGEMGSLLEIYGKDIAFLWTLHFCGSFHWYTVDSVEEYVKEIYDAIDKNFVQRLLPERTRELRSALTSQQIKPWWRNEVMEVVNRTVKMEKTILGRDFRSAESEMVKMILILSRMRVDLSSNHDHNAVMSKLVANAGFVYGYEINVEFEDVRKMEIERIMDPLLSPTAALFRYFYFYADVDLRLLTRKARLDRIIAKDAWMRNFVTSANVLEGILQMGIDVFNIMDVTLYLVGLGFLEGVAGDIANVLNNLEGDTGLLDIRDGGILADEFNISLGSRSRARERKIVFQCRMSNEEKTALRSAIFAREQLCIQLTGKYFKEIVIVKKQYNVDDNRIYAPLFISRRKNASGLHTTRRKLCDLATLMPLR